MFCYVKFFYNFWSLQPVFHYYNIFNWLKKNGIINNELPIINKYCNFKDIKTFKYYELTNLDKQYVVNFLKNNFLYGEKCTQYILSLNEFNPFFENNNNPSFISIYSNNKILYNNNDIININNIKAIITSRPLYISLYKNDFMVYYVDFLCVDKEYRKKNIAPQMIQTHELFQRYNNRDIKVCLFKREGKLTGIVPLCVFNSFFYEKLSCYKIKDQTISIINITDKTYYLLNDFLLSNYNSFDCVIIPHILNINTLLNTKNIYIFILKKNNDILACYFFKTNCTLYKNKKIIECYASINNCPFKDIFYKGFTLAYYQMAKIMKTRYIIIENISHNYHLLEQIKYNNNDKLKLIDESPNAFFLYNYLSNPINSDKSFIIY